MALSLPPANCALVRGCFPAHARYRDQKNRSPLKELLIGGFLLLVLLSQSLSVCAAEASPITKSLEDLVGRIQAQVSQGKKTKAELASLLAEFDALFAKYQYQKTDEVANILATQAQLYMQVLDDSAKSRELVARLKSDFPYTASGRKANEMLASITKREEAHRAQAFLVAGSQFPGFSEVDVARRPLSLSNYKGKVVLIDFWASWSRPYLSQLSNLVQVYEKYHGQGFEIIGINLDEDEMTLTAYTSRNRMPWPEFSDGRAWNNKLALRYGVNSLPTSYLLDTDGRIIAKDLHGRALSDAVASALPKK